MPVGVARILIGEHNGHIAVGGLDQLDEFGVLCALHLDDRSVQHGLIEGGGSLRAAALTSLISRSDVTIQFGYTLGDPVRLRASTGQVYNHTPLQREPITRSEYDQDVVVVQLTYTRRRPDVETHVLPDGTCLLFDPVGNEGYVLNAAGALVWDYCDGMLTGAEIAQELVALLPEHPEVREETERILQDLAERGLVLSVEVAAAPRDGQDLP